MLYDYLYEFSVAAQEGNLSLAARRLGISRASLGRHIDALETQLGTELLRRGPDGVRLTEDGHYAFDAALEVANVGEAARRACSPDARRCADTKVTVAGATDCATPLGLITKACAALSGPQRHLTCRALTPLAPDAAARLLSQGKADIALCFMSAGRTAALRNSGLETRPLCRVAAAVAVEQGCALASAEELSLSDLAACRFDRDGFDLRDDGVWDEFAHACAQAGVSVRTRSLADPLFERGGARNGNALACAAESAAADALRRAGRRVLPVRGLELAVAAVFRCDDGTVRELVENAARSYDAGERANPARRESIYGAAPRDKDALDTGSLSDIAERARVFSKVLQETPVTDDLILPDGRVVDRAYVALRNRLNRLADGLSGNPVETSFDAIMHLWSVEEARAMLEMPLFDLFCAFDWAVSTGRDERECACMLEDLASRGLLYRVRRGGTPYYALIPWAYGLWEFQVGRENTELLNLGIYGSEEGTGSRFPIMHTCPVGPEAVEGGTIVAYRDWQAHVRRQSVISIAPCQCRAAEKAQKPEAGDDGHPEEVCFTFGEMAQYWIKNGLGRQVTQQECLDRARAAIEEHGLVPQMYYDRNPEALCLCRPGCCLVLSAVRSSGGQAATMPLMSAYRLHQDPSLCRSCGLCAQRCPMEAIDPADGSGFAAGPTCVACGQCVAVCPAHARLLVPKPASEMTNTLPADMAEGFRWRSEDRMARGYITDFTGTRLVSC